MAIFIKVLDMYICLNVSRTLSKEIFLNVHTQLLEVYSSEQRQTGTLSTVGTVEVGAGQNNLGSDRLSDMAEPKALSDATM